MIDISEIFSIMLKFNKKLYTLFSPVDIVNIKRVEDKIGLQFPFDYLTFLKKTNGAYILQQSIYGLQTEEKDLDGFSSYDIEHLDTDNPMYNYLFPISPDGAGNHYCLDLQTLNNESQTCKVVFWQHDYSYSEIDPPDVDSDSFSDFIKKIIDEYLEEYDYNGIEK